MKRKGAIITIGALLVGCSSGTPGPMPSPSQTSTPNTPEGKLRAQLLAGGLVALPAGTLVINDPPLIMAAGTVLRGAGIEKTILKYTGTSHLLYDADNATISDMTLDGSLCPRPAPSNTFDVALMFIQSRNSTLRRVRIQSAPSFGVFSAGASTVIQSCEFDDCGPNGQDALGGGSPSGVLYDSNVFTNCHGNAIDNCTCIGGTWSNNSVVSLASSGATAENSGDIIVDGGCKGVVVKNNTLTVGAIQVFDATGCSHGPPVGNQVIDNVIQMGSLCDVPLCAGLYIISGNTHHGNVIAGVPVD